MKSNSHKNVFLAYTPYHALLLTGKAYVECPQDENYLFVFSDFDNAQTLVDSLRQWEGSPFKAIEILEGSYNEAFLAPWAARRLRYWVKLQQGTYLTKFIRTQNVSRVYLCNDQKVQSQYVLRGVSKNHQILCDFLEDGSFIYQSIKGASQKLSAIIISKLIFGFWWKDVTILGLHKNIRNLYVAYPEIVREELKHLQIKKLNPEFLLNLRETSFLKDYYSFFKLDNVQDAEVLLILPHSEFFDRHPKYQKVMSQFIDFVIKNKIRLTLKYHPRESRKNYLSLSKEVKSVILPNTFPIEILFLQYKKLIKIIIGDVSTALFTAKWLIPEVKIISIAKIVECQDEYFIRSGRFIGMDIPENIQILEEIIRESLKYG